MCNAACTAGRRRFRLYEGMSNKSAHIGTLLATIALQLLSGCGRGFEGEGLDQRREGRPLAKRSWEAACALSGSGHLGSFIISLLVAKYRVGKSALRVYFFCPYRTELQQPHPKPSMQQPPSKITGGINICSNCRPKTFPGRVAGVHNDCIQVACKCNIHSHMQPLLRGLAEIHNTAIHPWAGLC